MMQVAEVLSDLTSLRACVSNIDLQLKKIKHRFASDH